MEPQDSLLNRLLSTNAGIFAIGLVVGVYIIGRYEEGKDDTDTWKPKLDDDAEREAWEAFKAEYKKRMAEEETTLENRVANIETLLQELRNNLDKSA